MGVLSGVRHTAQTVKAWVQPVAGYSITTPFGATGSHWSSGRHTGVDFACPTGTPVRAAAAGRIVSAGPAGAYGNRIRIVHRPGLETWYCHLSEFAQTFGPVAAGAVIARSGATGNVTGPHLHFEVRRDGIAVDPAPYLSGAVSAAAPPIAAGGTAPAAGVTTNPALTPSASTAAHLSVGDTAGALGVELRRFVIVMATVLGGVALIAVGVAQGTTTRKD